MYVMRHYIGLAFSSMNIKRRKILYKIKRKTLNSSSSSPSQQHFLCIPAGQEAGICFISLKTANAVIYSANVRRAQDIYCTKG